MGPLRQFKVFIVTEDSWQDNARPSYACEELGQHIIWAIQDEVDFLFSMTVTQIFQNNVGLRSWARAGGSAPCLVVLQDRKEASPYERRPKSAACIPFGQGDFYYDGAFPWAALPGAPEPRGGVLLNGIIHDQIQVEQHLRETPQQILFS